MRGSGGPAASAEEPVLAASPCSVLSRGAITRERARAIIGAPMSTSVAARTGGSDAVNRNIGRQPEASLPLISGMRPVGMKRAAIFLTALAALWAAPAHAQTDFLTLQENVDASDTALMCPTRADNYVASTPITGTRDGIIFPNTSRATPPNPLDRHLSKQHRIAPAEACAAAVSICRRNCAEHSDAATMTDCYLR